MRTGPSLNSAATVLGGICGHRTRWHLRPLYPVAFAATVLGGICKRGAAPGILSMEVLHESALHWRDRPDQLGGIAPGHRAGHRAFPAEPRSARRVFPARGAADRCGQPGPGGGQGGAARPGLRRRGRLDCLYARPGGCRHRAVLRPCRPVHLHQLGKRVPETPDALPHHRVHSAGQPVLAVQPGQDRLRGIADARVPGKGLPGRPLSARATPMVSPRSPPRLEAGSIPGRSSTA